jgi:hypothetical protein
LHRVFKELGVLAMKSQRIHGRTEDIGRFKAAGIQPRSQELGSP